MADSSDIKLGVPPATKRYDLTESIVCAALSKNPDPAGRPAALEKLLGKTLEEATQEEVAEVTIKYAKLVRRVFDAL